MAYIGRDPQYGAFEKQSLTADGSTTTFTLDYTIGSSSSILVSVAGVHQEPETAYNLATNGTQITFTAAPVLPANLRNRRSSAPCPRRYDSRPNHIPSPRRQYTGTVLS